MSTGHGAIQRAILEHLADGRAWSINDLCQAVYRRRLSLPTEAELHSVRRAVRGLEGGGHVTSRRIMEPTRLPVPIDTVPLPDGVTLLRGWRPGKLVKVKAVQVAAKCSDHLDTVPG